MVPDPERPPLAQTVAALIGDVLRALRSERTRVLRLLDNLALDETRAAGAPDLLLKGEVLKTQLASVPRGATQVVLAVPWQVDVSVTIALDPALSAQDNVQRLFKRAKGLQRAQAVVVRRREEAQQRLALYTKALDEWQVLQVRVLAFDAAVAQALPPPERARELLRAAQHWCDTATALGLRKQQAPPSLHPPKAKPRDTLPPGVEAFTSPLGQQVFAGKSAAGNDMLVTRLLRGRDWWFHVRDQTGAHVVLQGKGADPPPLAEWHACAALCGHLSGIAKGERVEVLVCAGKDVRKVKGAPAGSVYARNEKSLRVAVAADVVDAFYARRQQQQWKS